MEDINELLIKAFKIKRYRIIRCIELTNTTKQTHTADTRKGVAVKHIPEQFTTKKEQGVTLARTHELYDKTKMSDPHADRSFLVRMFIRDLINTPKPYNHIFKNAHFSIILFCGTMYLQRRILHYES